MIDKIIGTVVGMMTTKISKRARETSSFALYRQNNCQYFSANHCTFR